MTETNGHETRSWYRSAGLSIMSAVALDELALPAAPGVADLTIELIGERRASEFASSTHHVLTIGEEGAPWLEVLRGDDGYLARWPEKLDVLIPDGGRQMLVHERGPLGDSLPRLLLCQAMSFVLAAHGREGMHASAVEIDGRAIVISGQSGRGKSTLATALCQEGARLLADDLTSIRLTDEGIPIVDPGSHRTWMWRELAVQMVDGGERRELERSHKIAVGGERIAAAQEPVPIGAFYLLRYKAGTPEVSELLPQREAVRAFVSGLFNFVLKDASRLETQFVVGTAVAHHAGARVLRWEVSPEAARAVARSIIEDVRAARAPAAAPVRNGTAQMNGNGHVNGTAQVNGNGNGHENGNGNGHVNGNGGGAGAHAEALAPAPDRRRLLDLLSAVGVTDAVDDDGFDEPLLRTSQVAALLRTSDRTIRTWAEAGKLTFIKTLGGRRLFPASAVMHVLNEMRHSAREEA